MPSIDWTHYHNYTEIVNILLVLNETYSNVVDVFSIGESWLNREIYCVRLTNESDQKAKPEVFFVGYHHAREPITAELTLYFTVYAASNFGSNTTITELINKSEIYVVVALNVDGFDLFQANDHQRKNARPTDEDYDASIDEDPPEDADGDGFAEYLVDTMSGEFIRWEGIDNDNDGKYGEDWKGGVDLNRNYNFAWENGDADKASEIYKGPTPFSEPETEAIRDLVLQHNFSYAISFHSGIELILYPWGHTHDLPPDEAKFIEISSALSNITGGTPYEQASDLYFSYGVWDDWMYGTAGVLALTCEVFANDTVGTVYEPGPLPNTMWVARRLRYWFNPFPSNIEHTALRWLPAFFYITNRTINDTHDVTINQLKPSRTLIGEGYAVDLNVSVQNNGFFEETFNVTIYANATILQTKPLTLRSKEDISFMLAWNTTGFPRGNYAISAYAWPVQGEVDITDNNSTDNWLFITIAGDLDADRDVDIFDIVTIAGSYGSTEGEPRYDGNCDIDGDGDVDIFDIVIAAGNYGESPQVL